MPAPACAWCPEPATERLVEPTHKRLPSGTMVPSGTGKQYEVCRRCAERLAGRHGGLKRRALLDEEEGPDVADT